MQEANVPRSRVAALFGGTGFIGSYLALELLNSNSFDKIYLFDLEPICDTRFLPMLSEYVSNGAIEYQLCDVRKGIADQINLQSDDVKIELAVNLAAIHREPGHEAEEYYHTNILGAENICAWCEEVNCNDLIFTSSIAPYGLAAEEKDEQSLPVPLTPYGGSKLAAEKVCIGWQKSDAKKQLTIVRPGVVFGPGEGGNVSRLIKAVLGGYFFYMGNKNTRKAGTYVKELTRAILWVHLRGREAGSGNYLFNMTMAPAPSVSEYVETILKVSGKNKWIPTVPFWLLYVASFPIEWGARLLRVNQPISPVRLNKLVKSNYIEPKFLISHNYVYKYTLQTAFKEWKEAAPDEWLVR